MLHGKNWKIVPLIFWRDSWGKMPGITDQHKDLDMLRPLGGATLPPLPSPQGFGAPRYCARSFGQGERAQKTEASPVVIVLEVLCTTEGFCFLCAQFSY